jgi:hypothetical protein
MAAENGPVRKRRSGIIGSGARCSQATNPTRQSDPRPMPITFWASPQPPRWLPWISPPDEQADPAADQSEGRQVESGPGPKALSQVALGADKRPHSDGDVDPEDPMPIESLGERSSDQGAAGYRQTGDTTPDADHRSPLLGRKGRGEQRQAQRHDDRRPGSLEDPAEDKNLVVGGQRARCRCGRE